MLASAVAPSRVPPRPRARRARRRATVRAVGDAPDARPPAIGRRAGLVGGLGAGLAAPWLPFASPDAAAKLDVVYEGVPTTAYTFPVPLNVVALRGSVGSQWDAEFNKILVGKGKVSVVAVPAPGDVYADLLASAPPPPTPQTIPPAGSFAPPTPEQIAERRRQEKAKTSKKKAPSGKTAKADVVSLGDEFLAPAIAAGLILPLDRTAPASEWYARTPPNWRRVVSRDANGRFVPPPAPSRLSRGFPNVGAATHPADASTVYGVPYRWGCQLIAYRVDKLPPSMRDRPPRDWSDLWRPEFAKRVALPGGPRAMLTAATRAEGLSANPDGLTHGVRDRLERLRREQLLVQDDVEYAQALTVGDAWIAVGPSDDVLALARKSSLVRVAAPESGTALFADVWCVPASAARKPGGVSPLVNQWLDYTTLPSRANLRVGLRGGIAPGLFDGDAVDYAATRMDGPTGGFVRYDVGDADRKSWFKSAFATVFGGEVDEDAGGDLMTGGMPPDEVWAASEFLEPLSPRAAREYNDVIAGWAAGR